MALRLGEMLLRKGLLSQEALEEAIAEQGRSKEFLGQVLMRTGAIAPHELLATLAEQQGIAFLTKNDMNVEPEAVKRVPANLAWHHKIMPLRVDGNLLTVALSDPFDMWPVDDLETNLGYTVEKVLATPEDIEEVIRKHYGVGGDTIERILADRDPVGDSKEAGEDAVTATAPSAAAGTDVQDLARMAEAASVVKLVNQILQQAIQDRATDIHFESFREDVFLRYRVDGVLKDAKVSDKIRHLYPAVTSRIKVMSGLDIIERRLPQDGRARVRVSETEYDLRVAVLPTLHGENIVIRILPTSMLFRMEDLGLHPDDAQALNALIECSHGVLFVTGPTGSGKTTTLYACLSRLNTRERKLITVEDPIEYELKGVSQVQVNRKIDLTFARTLRAMLRHDPEVLMVGEVRDAETAQIVMQASMTGHLVLSTLHTNDAASAATRLLDIGVEPYLVASSTLAFIAQRLVRVVCEGCGQPVPLTDAERRHADAASVALVESAAVRRGKGCDACGRSGYRGRCGIYEILRVSDAIGRCILAKAASSDIEAKALGEGMHTLRQDGWRKILAGLTTPEELVRVTHGT